jgi:hypothetical protein
MFVGLFFLNLFTNSEQSLFELANVCKDAKSIQDIITSRISTGNKAIEILNEALVFLFIFDACREENKKCKRKSRDKNFMQPFSKT